MSFGHSYALGLIPFEGCIMPYGVNNAIPNKFRNYFFYYEKTNIPIPHIGQDWGNYPIYPLGMKALPNRQFLSKRRQLYRAIIDTDFDKIDKIAEENTFNLTSEILNPDLNLTAMGMATTLNLLEVVHYLTKRGVDLEHKIGPYCKTALHLAVENGNELLAKYLLNNGADLTAKDIFGFDVYDKAEFRGYYHFNKIFDHFRDNSKSKKDIDYMDYKYTRELILEDIDTNEFIPSKILEFTITSLLNPHSEYEKIDLNKFEFNMLNYFNYKKIEEGFKLRKRYDDLEYFYSFKL